MWAQVFALFIVHVLYQLPQPVNAAAHRKIHDEIGAAREYDAVQALLKQYYKKAAKRFGIASDYDPNRINQAAQNVIYDDGTEMSRNRKVLGDLFENDIVLTVEQAQHLLDTFEDDIRRTKRNAYPNPNGFWKNPTAIPYRFSVGEDDWKEDIRAALAHIESETCLRFVENGAGADSILFIRGSGCYSSVGRVGGQQQVSIGYGCESLGIVAHELTHALGFWHEQSRRDRDYNIWINFANIFDGTQGNFEIRDARTIDNMGQPYDLGSVMHYGSRGFSIRWDLYTIQTRDPKYQNTLGQRTGLAFIDAKQHNIRYCSKACPVALNCRNGGYVDPNNCNQCKCPAGLSGTYCMSVQPS
uniref:Zinc metalloproteinase n=1 Tax=Plectus sambesii TaxID=2011161 RepID=A0A914XNJ3_9BILA